MNTSKLWAFTINLNKLTTTIKSYNKYIKCFKNFKKYKNNIEYVFEKDGQSNKTAHLHMKITFQKNISYDDWKLRILKLLRIPKTASTEFKIITNEEGWNNYMQKQQSINESEAIPVTTQFQFDSEEYPLPDDYIQTKAQQKKHKKHRRKQKQLRELNEELDSIPHYEF